MHRKHHPLPREFARTLRTAVAEAVRALRVPKPETVIADLGIATCEEAAVVRIGPQAGAVVRVRRLQTVCPAARGRSGSRRRAGGGGPGAAAPQPVSAGGSGARRRAVCGQPGTRDRLHDAPGRASAGQRAYRQDADAVEAECRRLRFAAWGEPKPASGRVAARALLASVRPDAPAGETHPQLAVYATAGRRAAAARGAACRSVAGPGPERRASAVSTEPSARCLARAASGPSRWRGR